MKLPGIWKTAGLASLLLLSACTRDPEVRMITVDTGCFIFAPIYLKPGEARILSPQSRRQINDHNEVGAKRCNWQPSQKESTRGTTDSPDQTR